MLLTMPPTPVIAPLQATCEVAMVSCELSDEFCMPTSSADLTPDQLRGWLASVRGRLATDSELDQI